ncbi:MAG: hypothetical protein K2I01_05480 [Lachnospiraceae bacterium]|nr:hypothetical protein [Lachnospiraceae bacterium]
MKKSLRILTAGFVGILLLSGCGKEQTEKSPLSLAIADVLKAEYLAAKEAAMSAKADIEGAGLTIEEVFLGKDVNCRYIFHPDDFVPEEIACANVFRTYQDGRENPVLLGLYEEAGEAWEYLYYAEYDINGDGRMDYVAVHGNHDDAMEENGYCGGDIWCLSKDGIYERVMLPKALYLTGGTWQEPELFVMTLVYSYKWGSQGIAVYRDYEKQEMALYGWQYNYDNSEEAYKRVRTVTVTEEISDTALVQTGFRLLYNDDEERVRIEIKGREGNPDFYQVILTDRKRVLLSQGEQTCTVWDGNDDSYEDILYYAGYDGGSGGDFDDYKLFVWFEEEGKYVKTELPQCIFIDYEAHKICNRGQVGAPHQVYEIYGLQNGEYQLEKGLDLYYESWDGDKMIDVAVYSEWGEEVERTDITGLSWEETQVLLEEKYPEFNFWRQG